MQSAFNGNRLIFIISQPRSGSTLLQRILAGHPDIHSSAETWLLLNPIYGLRNGSSSAEYNTQWATRAVREFLLHYTDGNHVYYDGIREMARVIYGNALDRSGKRFFLDKTPRYYLIIPELLDLFPQARVVILLRNPMAVLASELKTYVNGDWSRLANVKIDLLNGPHLLANAIEQHAQRIHLVRYETLVSEPEMQISGLCQSLGITFDPNMLEYANTPAPKGTMNDTVGIHQHRRPSTANVEKWKKIADDRQACYFARCYLQCLGPDLLRRLGYSFTDIEQVLGGSAVSQDTVRDLFPWEQALRPQNEWNFRDHLAAIRYKAFASHTGIKAYYYLARHTARLLRRTFHGHSSKPDEQARVADLQHYPP